MTEKFKLDSETEIKAKIEKLDNAARQIDQQVLAYAAEMKKAGKLKELENLKRQVAQEKGRLALQKKVFQKQAEEISRLLLGAEYPRGTMESWVEVNVGDDFYKKVGGLEILLQDGIVKDIRRS